MLKEKKEKIIKGKEKNGEGKKNMRKIIYRRKKEKCALEKKKMIR